MSHPTRGRLRTIGGDGRQPTAGRIDAGVERPAPRFGDGLTHSGHSAAAQEPLPLMADLSGPARGRRRCVDGHPRIVSTWLRHESPACLEPHPYREATRRVEGLDPPGQLASYP